MRINKKLTYPLQVIGIAIIVLFMMFEEIILSPLRKLKIIFIVKTIGMLNGFWTIALLVSFKTVEGLIKVFFIFGLVTDPLWIGFWVFMDGFLGFLSLNLIIYGRDNLKQYRSYRKLAIWFYRKKKIIKQHKYYIKAKYYVVTTKVYIHAFVIALSIRLFGNEKGVYHNLKRYIKAGIIKYKRSKRSINKKKILGSPDLNQAEF
jgi:hypothetical protein